MASERTAIETLRRLGIENPSTTQIDYLRNISGNSLAIPLILEYLENTSLSYGAIATKLAVSVDAVKYVKRAMSIKKQL